MCLFTTSSIYSEEKNKLSNIRVIEKKSLAVKNEKLPSSNCFNLELKVVKKSFKYLNDFFHFFVKFVNNIIIFSGLRSI